MTALGRRLAGGIFMSADDNSAVWPIGAGDVDQTGTEARRAMRRWAAACGGRNYFL